MGRGRGRGGGGGGPQPPASPRWAHGTAPVPGPSGQALFLRGPRAPRGGFGCTHTTAPQRAVGAASGERPQQRLLGSGGGGGSRVWVQEPTKTPWGRGGGQGGDPVGPGPAKKNNSPMAEKHRLGLVAPSTAGSGPRVGAGAGGTTGRSHTLTAPNPGLGRGRRTPGAESDPTNPCWGSRAILPPSPACGSAHHQALADGCHSGAGRQGPTPYPQKRSRSRSQDVST